MALLPTYMLVHLPILSLQQILFWLEQIFTNNYQVVQLQFHNRHHKPIQWWVYDTMTICSQQLSTGYSYSTAQISRTDTTMPPGTLKHRGFSSDVKNNVRLIIKSHVDHFFQTSIQTLERFINLKLEAVNISSTKIKKKVEPQKLECLHELLVGGWTNPSEKIWDKLDHFTTVSW